MSKRLGLVAAALFAILATGCPYEAETSLGEPSEPVDSRLIGAWTTTGGEDEEPGQVRVTRSGDMECQVEITGEDDEEATLLRVFMVRVGGEPFLNISEIKDGEEDGFVFARYSFSDSGELTIRLVDSKAIPESLKGDRSGLVNYLKSHLRDASLDDTDGPMRLVPARAN